MLGGVAAAPLLPAGSSLRWWQKPVQWKNRLWGVGADPLSAKILKLGWGTVGPYERAVAREERLLLDEIAREEERHLVREGRGEL